MAFSVQTYYVRNNFVSLFIFPIVISTIRPRRRHLVGQKQCDDNTRGILPNQNIFSNMQ